MKPADHYREAEKLLENARLIVEAVAQTTEPEAVDGALEAVTQLTARAQVHATLAAIPREERR